MDGPGFYKVDGELLYAPVMVSGPDWDLIAELRDSYAYPFEGWYWFESEIDARAFFGLPAA